MSEPRPHDETLLRDNRIDDACDRFERQLLAVKSPRLEDALADATDVDRAKLLRELEVRRTNEDYPAAIVYEPRFPDDVVVIAEAFDAVATRFSSVSPAKGETVNVSLRSTEETLVPVEPELTRTFVSDTSTTQPAAAPTGVGRVTKTLPMKAANECRCDSRPKASIVKR